MEKLSKAGNTLFRTWPRVDTVNESLCYLVKESLVQNDKENLGLETRNATCQARAAGYLRYVSGRE